MVRNWSTLSELSYSVVMVLFSSALNLDVTFCTDSLSCSHANAVGAPYHISLLSHAGAGMGQVFMVISNIPYREGLFLPATICPMLISRIPCSLRINVRAAVSVKQ